jgi:hypothetical protein
LERDIIHKDELINEKERLIAVYQAVLGGEAWKQGNIGVTLKKYPAEMTPAPPKKSFWSRFRRS